MLEQYLRTSFVSQTNKGQLTRISATSIQTNHHVNHAKQIIIWTNIREKHLFRSTCQTARAAVVQWLTCMFTGFGTLLDNYDLRHSLKGYYDQKSPYLFFLHFESMIYKYLPRQILGHDFYKKSDFFELRTLKTIIRYYSIKKWLSSKENWVEGGCDVIQSRHLN